MPIQFDLEKVKAEVLAREKNENKDLNGACACSDTDCEAYRDKGYAKEVYDKGEDFDILAFDSGSDLDGYIDVSSKKINDKKIKVFVGEYFLPVYKGEYFKYFKDDRIDKDSFLKLRESIINRAKKRVYYLLSDRAYTAFEIRTKLARSAYHYADIDIVIAYFRRLSYLDDYEYADRYINLYKDRKSIRQIKDKLRTKGVDRHIIDELIFSLDEIGDIQYNLALEQGLKKYNSLKQSDKVRDKLYSYLARRGYDYGIISRVITEILYD